MVDYYVGGGSAWSSGDDPTVWFNLDIDGHDSSLHASYNTGDIDATDPFILMANTGTLVTPSPVLFIGLSGSYHIKIDEAGISGFDGIDWFNLMDGDGGGGPGTPHTVINDTPTDEEVLTGASSNWAYDHLQLPNIHHRVTAINDTPTDEETLTGVSSNWAYDHLQLPNIHHIPTAAGDLSHNGLNGLNDGDEYEHITLTQKNLLHGIYTLEPHDNTKHSPNYEEANGNIQSHVSNPSGIPSSHHAKYTNSDAITAVEGEADLTLGAQVSIDGMGWFEAGNNPGGSAELMYGGYFYAARIYNAVYNDYADFWKHAPGVEEIPGYCYSFTKKGLIISNKRADKACVGICSDTYGFATGPQRKGIPISVAGFVLAYIDKEYKTGTRLVNNKHGILTKAKIRDIIMGKQIAIYLNKETKMQTKGIFVKGRFWVKVL